MDRLELRDDLLAEARRRGFAAAGVAGVRPFRRARERGLRAVAEGRMDGMPWYTARRVEGITDPARPHPWARSLLSLAWPCPPAMRPDDRPPSGDAGRPRGRISSYACLPGGDYHDVLAQACDDLAAWLRSRVPELRSKRFVDHGWAMDRAVAERAGVGFAGKHASIITRTAGSYVLLAEMLLSVSLPPTPPSRRTCGQCSACLPACPTGAIREPGVIDARRCISYLTIEHRGPIPLELRPLMGTWAFGCDLCQEACPINRRLAPQPLPDTGASTARGPVPFPDLVECLQLDDDAFRQRFRHTAVWRAGRAGLARNAAVALGNAGDRAALPALRAARDGDPDPAVREAAGWAMARLGA
ncbi:MAG TPA: tRNA epoxyqueuosine(34) reductase QueG [Candidatus Dormibacteraeota bacterium]|nr:tRNA epoxyqueuosine(34) reductase QueG [Candidatus Dormibacteraeota bacterium]